RGPRVPAAAADRPGCVRHERARGPREAALAGRRARSCGAGRPLGAVLRNGQLDRLEPGLIPAEHGVWRQVDGLHAAQLGDLVTEKTLEAALELERRDQPARTRSREPQPDAGDAVLDIDELDMTAASLEVRLHLRDLLRDQ